MGEANNTTVIPSLLITAGKDGSEKDATLENIEISEHAVETPSVNVEEGAKVKVLELLNKMKASQWKNFGNARGIRNLFEKFVMNQANRLVKIENPTRDDLMIIKEADVFDR